MPDLFELFYRWRKQIISLVIATTAIATVIVFCIPKKYLGVATALPAPSFATDKTGVFSQNLQAVYSAFGSPDDLDKILGTARLDTVYIAVAGKLDLAKHYNIANDEPEAIRKAARFLKKRTKVIRTDYGELQVKVWDKNKIFAASLSNAIMEKLQGIHQDVQTANNEMMLAKINEEYSEEKLEYQKLLDSLQHTTSEAVIDLLNIQKTSLLQQMQEYEQLSKKYKLMVDARPQALIIIENATPPLKADKPNPLQVIICAAILGFFFALITALVFRKKKTDKKVIKSQTYNSQSGFILLSGIFLVSLALALISSLYWIIAIPFGILFFYFGWQRRNLIFFLLIFFLPWSVEYSFNASFGTDLPDEPLMLLTATLFTCRFFFRPTDISWVWKHSLILLLLVYLGWIVVTVPFSTDWILSIKFLLAKSWYILAFVFAPFLVLKNKKSIRMAGIVFLVSMLSLVIIVLFRHALLGFTFANINNAVNPFFRNHVNYSAMLVCTFPVLVATYQSNKRFGALIFIAAIVVLVALFLSYSRGAWLALLVGIVSYWLIQKKKLLFAFLVSLVLILASVFGVSKNDRYLDYANDFKTTIFHKNFEKHLIATYKLKDLSTAERFNRWIAGARMTSDNLLTGFGPNTFYNNYKPYTLPSFKTWVSKNTEHSTVHNYFLLVLIEQGIPGLVFFLMLVCGLIYYSEKLYARISDPFYKAVAMACGVIVMMIITVNFLSDLIETDKVGSLFFLCLSLLVTIDIKTRKGDIENLDTE